MIRVAIIGASGYTGAESIKIILNHSHAELTYLTALPQECGAVDEVFGQFKGRCDLPIEPLDFDKLSGLADVALCCLPHKVSMGFVPRLLAAGLKVVDFSADYRIKDTAVYEKYYQVEHTDKANLERAVFGLPELFRDKIKAADLVANPGCFPTGAILAIAPLLKHGLIETDSIIVNAITGASGAGKNPSEKFHFPNMNENLFAYATAGPFDRGIMSSVYCQPKKKLTEQKLSKLYDDFYSPAPFVRICSEAPNLKDVAGTNYCHIFSTAVKDRVVVFSAIDNLVKGASGQAVQNMNIIFGLDETLGLK